MNKTKIEWTDCSLNPVVGCRHGCPYCYARMQAYRQKQKCQMCYEFINPHPHLDRLKGLSPKQKPKKIFIDSMWDWNSEGVEEEWLGAIIEKMAECPQHTFQILSKRPERYDRFDLPLNVWIGTSIATNAEIRRVQDLAGLKGKNLKFVSIEPIHEAIDFQFSRSSIDWLIIGAETGHRKDKVRVDPKWIASILENAKREGIPLFIKNNAGWHDKVQEFPNERGSGVGQPERITKNV